MAIPHKYVPSPEEEPVNITGTNVMDLAPAPEPMKAAPMASPIAPGPRGLDANPIFNEPPPGYMPGPSSAIKLFDDQSMLYKIGTTLASFNSDMPVHMKLKLAEMEANRKQQETKLGWDNFYKSTAQFKQLQHEHDREAQMAYFQNLPRLKYQIASIKDPVARQKFTDMASKFADNLYPGGGEFLQYFAKNPASVFDGDDLAEDKDYGPRVQELIGSMGYENWMKSKQREEISAGRNHDRFSYSLGHMRDADMQKLANEGMDEEEFRKAYTLSLDDQLKRGEITERGHMAARLYLNQPEAEEQMAGYGVRTNKAKLAQQVKMKAEGPQSARAAQDFAEWTKIVDTAKANPNQTTYTPAQVAEAQESIDIAQKQRAPRSNPTDTPNNEFNQMLALESKGRITSVSDIAKLPAAEQPAMYALAKRVKQELIASRPQASATAQEGKAADTTGYFDAREFRKNGTLKGLRGEYSAHELRSSRDVFKATPKQIDEIKTYSTIDSKQEEIFNKAYAAYDPKNSDKALAAAEALIMNASQNPQSIPAQVAAVPARTMYPDLELYISAREGVLGQFARTVSGEVGVLTDQDAGRVRGLFAVAGDSPKVITAKAKALKKLLALNKAFMSELLTGDTDATTLRNDSRYNDTVNGIFGSVNGLGKSTQESPKTGEKKKSKKTGVAQVMEEMEAGQ